MRRKKLPSRKRQALWRVLLALVSLLLVDHIFGIALLPIQAVRREAEHEGIGRAWVVERKWEPSLYKTHLFYLMENERAVMLGDTHLSPLGWETMFGATVDCTGEEPIYAGYHQISHDDKVLGCYFGQINDPAIETVVISIQQEEYDQGKAVRSEPLGRGAGGLCHRTGPDIFLDYGAPAIGTVAGSGLLSGHDCL